MYPRGWVIPRRQNPLWAGTSPGQVSGAWNEPRQKLGGRIYHAKTFQSGIRKVVMIPLDSKCPFQSSLLQLGCSRANTPRNMFL